MASTVIVRIIGKDTTDLASIGLYEAETNSKLVAAGFRNGDEKSELAALDKLTKYALDNGITQIG